MRYLLIALLGLGCSVQPEDDDTNLLGSSSNFIFSDGFEIEPTWLQFGQRDYSADICIIDVDIWPAVVPEITGFFGRDDVAGCEFGEVFIHTEDKP